MEQSKVRKLLAEISGHQATLFAISGGMMWDLFLTTEVYTGIADQVTNRLTYLDTISRISEPECRGSDLQ